MLTVRFESVIQLTDEVMMAAEHGDDMRLITDTLVTRGTALCNLLRWREGIAILDAALEMTNAHGLTATWFRAVNNILGYRAQLDPHGALELANGGLAVAQRLGDERWTQGLSGQRAFIGVRTGDWDNVALDLERMLATATDPRSRSNSVDNLASIRAAQGVAIDDLVAELEATHALDEGDGTKMLFLDAVAWRHYAAGRAIEARDLWTQVTELDPTNANSTAPLLARIAIAQNDADSADGWQRLHWESAVHGGAAETDHIALMAAVRGLRGDRNGATRDFREALRRYTELRLDVDEAIMAIDMVYVLGPADPLTADVVARARTTFAANHARTYLDQLEAAIAHGAHVVGGKPSAARADQRAEVRTS
jgi:hypothetical protein